MPTDTEKKLNGAPEPFRRPVVWGRPPATVFRAGPLPKGGTLPPLPEPPRRATGPGILSGSMIPRAAPARVGPPKAAAPIAGPLPAPAPPAEPVAAPAPARAAEPAFMDHAADLTVRPLPPLEPGREPGPEPRPAPVGPAAALQLDTLPAFEGAHEVERPSGRPPAAVAIPAGRGAKRTAPNRMPLYAGIAVAAVTVLALGAWIWTRPPAETPTPPAPTIPAEAAPLVAAPEIVSPEPEPVPVVETAAPETPAPASRPAAAPPPVDRTPAPAVVRPPAPQPEAVAPPVVTPPRIEIAPPQPTAAERPQSDPDAPIATRPQPIG